MVRLPWTRACRRVRSAGARRSNTSEIPGATPSKNGPGVQGEVAGVTRLELATSTSADRRSRFVSIDGSAGYQFDTSRCCYGLPCFCARRCTTSQFRPPVRGPGGGQRAGACSVPASPYRAPEAPTPRRVGDGEGGRQGRGGRSGRYAGKRGDLVVRASPGERSSRTSRVPRHTARPEIAAVGNNTALGGHERVEEP